MASRKTPEQRSTHSPQRPGQPAAKPTGGEVFEQATAAAQTIEAELPTAAEAEKMQEQVQRTATEYYERLSRSAEAVSRQAADVYGAGRGYLRQHPGVGFAAALAIGVLIGVLSNRR